MKTLYTCDPGCYAKIKSNSALRVGEPREPIAELTLFGRIIMSPGAKTNLSSVLTRSSLRTTDYKQLCSLNVLGLEDTSNRWCIVNSKSN